MISPVRYVVELIQEALIHSNVCQHQDYKFSFLVLRSVNNSRHEGAELHLVSFDH